MKTFIAGSPISHSLGMDSAPADRYGSGRNFTAPCLRILGRLSFHRAGCGANRPSANIWVGARRYSLPAGSGSAPSDPCRSNHIGNLGIRKSVKIRKIEKACFNHSIATRVSWMDHDPPQHSRSGKNADGRRYRPRQPGRATAAPEDSPLGRRLAVGRASRTKSLADRAFRRIVSSRTRVGL